MCYSASEAKTPDKFVDIIDIDDNSVSVQSVKIQPLHEFVTIDDALNSILSEKYPASEDYCYITVSGIEGEENIGARIRDKFPNLVRLYFKSDREESSVDIAEEEKRDFVEDFTAFYKEVTKEDIDEELLANAEHIFRLTEEACATGSEKQLMNEIPALVTSEQEVSHDDQNA